MANILNFIKKIFLIVKNALQKASDWVIDVLLKRWNFIIFIAIFTPSENMLYTENIQKRNFM